MDRRKFLQISGIFSAYAFSGSLQTMLHASKASANSSYFSKDPNRILDMHSSLSYDVISTKGSLMFDGNRVPGNPDGMAAFSVDSKHTVIVRNHELGRTSGKLMGPFKDSKKNALSLGKNHYDPTAFGGTTNILINDKTNEVVKEYLSLSGTMTNCAGGPSPWNTWLTCEENTSKNKKEGISHGYVFEVDPKKDFLQEPVPLKNMGRFSHEAVAFDRYGYAYLTEDRSDGLLYKFIPNQRNSLLEGDLYALKIKLQDSRNWKKNNISVGEEFSVEWVKLEDPDPDDDTLRKTGYEKGATIFARGEGITSDNNSVYFTCTSGGKNRRGQIWRLTPISKFKAKLELWFEMSDKDMINMPDNLTVAPWGDLIVCEDNPDIDRLWGIKPDGSVYLIAENSYTGAELAGVCFNQKNDTMYLNIQQNGQTIAIKGDWNRVRS
ncbi:MAG: alkaline phosphatase PhoX [bacterium]